MTLNFVCVYFEVEQARGVVVMVRRARRVMVSQGREGRVRRRTRRETGREGTATTREERERGEETPQKTENGESPARGRSVQICSSTPSS